MLNRLRCGSLAAWTDEDGFRSAIEQSPTAQAALFLADLAIDRAASPDLAEQAYRHACELDPKDAYPWNSLGNLLTHHLGRYEEAEQAYRHACELDPKYASPWNGLGNLLHEHWAGTRRRSRPIATPANWTRKTRTRGTTWATC